MGLLVLKETHTPQCWLVSFHPLQQHNEVIQSMFPKSQG